MEGFPAEQPSNELPNEEESIEEQSNGYGQEVLNSLLDNWPAFNPNRSRKLLHPWK